MNRSHAFDCNLELLRINEHGSDAVGALDPGFWLSVMAHFDRIRGTDKASKLAPELAGLKNNNSRCLHIMRAFRDVASECGTKIDVPGKNSSIKDGYLRTIAGALGKLVRRCSRIANNKSSRATAENHKRVARDDQIAAAQPQINSAQTGQHMGAAESSNGQLNFSGKSKTKYLPSSTIDEVASSEESHTALCQTSSMLPRETIRELQHNETDSCWRRLSSQTLSSNDLPPVKMEEATARSELNFNDPLPPAPSRAHGPQPLMQFPVYDVPLMQQQPQAEQKSSLDLSIENLKSRLQEAMTKAIDWTNVPVALFETEMELRKLSQALEQAKSAYAVHEV
jgi:hypothetical protein